MNGTQASFAGTLVDEWARLGVRHAVVCPGSRSTPLALALARDDRIHLHLKLDERSAGFFAIGLAKEVNSPVIVLVTSGTAAAELHPAVLEAHHGRTPLIVCTADRPPRLHHVGAPQTAEQSRLYGDAVSFFFEPGLQLASTSRHWWRSLASRAYLESMHGALGRGPVHLNIAFDDPLLEEPEELPTSRRGMGWHRRLTAAGHTPEVLLELLATVRKGVIVAGADSGDPLAMHEFARLAGWPVLADPRSRARLSLPTTVAAADAILRSKRFTEIARPEVVFRIGDPWASKVIAEWLEQLLVFDVPQVVVHSSRRWPDPMRSASFFSDIEPSTMFQEAIVRLGADGHRDNKELARRDEHDNDSTTPDWLGLWQVAEQTAQQVFEEMLEEGGDVNEPKVARWLFANLTSSDLLFLSSSMPVRDVEYFGPPRSDPLVVESNRGVNGIDGVISTILGLATARQLDQARYPKGLEESTGSTEGRRRIPIHDEGGGSGGGRVVGLVGDLAFLHDVSGLVGPGAVGVDATIIVFGNGGGGIFSLLPQGKLLEKEVFDKLFLTPPEADVVSVARGFKVNAEAVSDMDELMKTFHEPSEGLRVIYVEVPSPVENAAIHEELNFKVVEAIEEASNKGVIDA